MMASAHGDLWPSKGSGFVRNAKFERSFEATARMTGTRYEASTAWNDSRGTVVFSTLTEADAPDGSGRRIPQWHLSCSSHRGPRPERLSTEQLNRVVEAFGLDEFEIDNHHPGAAHQIWIPLDPAERVDCECKADETIIVEEDGYAWTNPKGARRCPLHENAGR